MAATRYETDYCRLSHQPQTPQHIPRENDITIKKTDYCRLSHQPRRLFSSKKGSQLSGRFVPALEKLLESWTEVYDHEDPLTHEWFEAVCRDLGEEGDGTEATSEDVSFFLSFNR